MRYDDFVTKKKGYLFKQETISSIKKSNNQFTIEELENLLQEAMEVGASRIEFDFLSGKINLNKQKIVEQEYSSLDSQGYLAECNKVNNKGEDK